MLILPKAVYFFVFAGLACASPFLSIFFETKGFSREGIGVLLAITPFTCFLFSSLWSLIADVTQRPHVMLACNIIATIILYNLFTVVDNFYFLLLLVFAQATFSAPILPLVDTWTLRLVEGASKDDYGRQRLWGAVSWGIVAATLGRFVDDTGNANLPLRCYGLGMGVSIGLLAYTNWRTGELFSLLRGAWWNRVMTGRAVGGRGPGSQKSHGYAPMATDGGDSSEYDDGGREDELKSVGLDEVAGSGGARAAQLLTGGADQKADEEHHSHKEGDHQVRALREGHGTNQGEDQGSSSGNGNGGSGNGSNGNGSGSNGNGTGNGSLAEARERATLSQPSLSERADSGGGGGDKEPSQRAAVSWASFRRVLTLPMCVFLCVAFMQGAGTSIVQNYLFLYLEELGGSKLLMGLSITCTVLPEFPMFYWGGFLVKRVGVVGLVLIGQFCYITRVFMYTLLKDPWWVLAIEPLHGITFACFQHAGVTIASRIAPKGLENTAQGIFNAVFNGMGPGVGSALGGVISGKWGFVVLFRGCGVAILAAMIAFWSSRAVYDIPSLRRQTGPSFEQVEQESVSEDEESPAGTSSVKAHHDDEQQAAALP